MAQIWAKALSTSVTPGPRNSIPVSRQGSIFFPGSPTHMFPTHKPEMKLTRLSTESSLR
jgi:hypothetical protein